MNGMIKKVWIGLILGAGLLAAVNIGAATLTINNPALVFGSQQIGASTTLPVTLTAVGGTVNFHVLGIDSPNFSLLNDCGAMLTVAASPCTLQVKYNPTQAGTRHGELLIRSDATNVDLPSNCSDLLFCNKYIYLQGNATGVPDAPTVVTATAGNTQATVTFTAPSDNGSAISGYTATANPGGATGTCAGAAACPVTVSSLANGTAYTFTVTATNGVGTGSASAASNQVTPKLGQTITFAQPGNNSFGTLTATADSGLPVTFSSSTGGVCTITAGGVLTAVSTGNCTITAAQAGNATYSAATSVTRTYSIAAANPNVITFVLPGAQSMGTTPTLTATATSGLPVTFTSSTANRCTITAGGVLTPVSAGNCTIIADQAGNAVFIAAQSVSRTFSINTLTPQTITFTAPGDINMGTTPTLTATATSGLAVTFSSSTAPVCTITAGGILTPVSVGSCTITASQAGNGTYAAATQVPQTFNIIAASQTIIFTNPGAQSMGATPTLTATATSGLAVTFSSSTAPVCTVTAGGVLTPVSVGSCTITASQAGNGTYAAATQVPQTFNITLAPADACAAQGLVRKTDMTTMAWGTGVAKSGFNLKSNEVYVLSFTAPSNVVTRGITTLYSAANKRITISNDMCGFDTPLNGSARCSIQQDSTTMTTEGGPAYSTSPTSNYCRMTAGQTYYVNIRNALPNTNPIQSSCTSAAGCAFWLAY